MMIGIMSDSHGDTIAIENAVAEMGQVDCWLHAGDYCRDADFLEKISGCPVYSVAGNCDGLAAKQKVDEFIELEGKKIWLTHGHHYHVKYGMDELVEAAVNVFEVDIVVYGHTHITDVSQYGNLLVLNPGSVSRPRFITAPTCLRLTIENGKLLTKLVEI